MKPFLIAFETRQRDERDRINMNAYLTGRYVTEAIAACFSKGAKYPDKPYDLRSQEEIDEYRRSTEFAEQQRLVMLTKQRQDERRAKNAEKRKEEFNEKGGWLSG